MHRLDFTFEVKSLGDDGTFEGYASTFGNKDQGGDVIMPGAFAKSIRTKGARGVKMLLDHDPRQRAGVFTALEEDQHGLKVAGKLLTEKTIGREAHIDLKAGALDGLSIGGRTTSDAYDGRKRARVIKEFDLYEISLVAFPMNEMARVSSVKSFDVDVIRAIETDLRKELNLSSAAAVSAVAIVKKHLREGGDLTPADVSREADAKAIADLLARFRAIGG
jgi:HK97 family phage prohead protease